MAAPIAPAVLAELLGSGWRRHRETADALADALRALAVDGRIAARTRVPSERALAPALGVGRGTVTRAYDRLREEGYLVSARGAGSWLTLPDGAPGRAAAAAAASSPPGRARSTSRSPRLPGPEPLLGEAAAAAAARLARHAHGHGYAGPGLPELRDAVARALHRSAACRPRPSRSSSRPAPSTACTSCSRCSARPPTACSSTRPPTRARSRPSAAPGCARYPSRSRPTAGSPARGRRRSPPPRRGSR